MHFADRCRQLVWMLCCVLSAAASSAVAASAGQRAVVNDTARGFIVYYWQEAGRAVFSVMMPTSWDVGILVDGDQDGKWGAGPDDPVSRTKASADLAYGRDADANYVLCAQYIETSEPGHAERIYSSSMCGAFASKATVEIGAPDHQGRVTMHYRIPNSELFGKNATAHVAFRLWDGKESSFYFSPSAPLVLRK